MTTKSEISAWFDRGVKQGATYMIVVCDTFDHEDYPVYAKSDSEAKEKYAHYDGNNMQRIMEVYDLKADKDEQLSERRVHRMPK